MPVFEFINKIYDAKWMRNTNRLNRLEQNVFEGESVSDIEGSPYNSIEKVFDAINPSYESEKHSEKESTEVFSPTSGGDSLLTPV